MPDQFLHTVISGRSSLLVDGRIMQEYRTVLQRPEFGLPPALVADLLVLIAASEWVVLTPRQYIDRLAGRPGR